MQGNICAFSTRALTYDYVKAREMQTRSADKNCNPAVSIRYVEAGSLKAATSATLRMTAVEARAKSANPGSSSFITDATGYATQHLQYLPFGETFVDQQSGYDSRYTFSAKEKDDETQYSYFGARYYDSDLSVWLSVDPLSDKYPNLSPYAYCANNPVMLVDPDGRDIYIIVQTAFDGTSEIKKYNAQKIIQQYAGSEMGKANIERFIASKTEDVYITIGNVGELADGITTRVWDESGNLTTPNTIDIASDSYINDNSDPQLSEFYMTQIDKNKDNYFVTLDEKEFGGSKLELETQIKKGAKVLAHEIGAHTKNKLQSYDEEEHDKWGQYKYGTFEAKPGSNAQKINSQIDKAAPSKNYNFKDLGRGRFKLFEGE